VCSIEVTLPAASIARGEAGSFLSQFQLGGIGFCLTSFDSVSSHPCAHWAESRMLSEANTAQHPLVKHRQGNPENEQKYSILPRVVCFTDS
jgi:hypothetical protein